MNCTGFIVSCQSCFHFSILKLEFARDAAWRLKGRRERRRWRPRFWAVAMRACRRREVSNRAFLTSMDVWCSLRSAGGAIPARTGRYFTGVGRRQPLTILMVSLRVTSIFFTWVLVVQMYQALAIEWSVSQGMQCHGHHSSCGLQGRSLESSGWRLLWSGSPEGG